METKRKEFIPEVCDIKHLKVDDDIKKMKEDIKEMKNEGEKQHEEIKKMITKLGETVQESHQNLKDKIVLSEKSTGDKIDSLNEFDEKLKGNGKPGVWESIRSIKNCIRLIVLMMVIIIILVLGGNHKGVTLDSIKKSIGVNETTEQVEQVEVTETTHVDP